MLFNVVDEGYDFFIGNNRFSKFSNVNMEYARTDSPLVPACAAQSKAKNNIGWYEMGKYDVSAMFDKATEVRPGKVHYNG